MAMSKKKFAAGSVALMVVLGGTLVTAVPASAAGCSGMSTYSSTYYDYASTTEVGTCVEVRVRHKFSPDNTPYVGWTSLKKDGHRAVSNVTRQLLSSEHGVTY